MKGLADLSPTARHLYFRLRNHVLRSPELVCSCCCCRRTLHISGADYQRFRAHDDGGASLVELLESGAVLAVFGADGQCQGAAVIVDFGVPSGGDW